jgi:hypothetical protein
MIVSAAAIGFAFAPATRMSARLPVPQQQCQASAGSFNTFAAGLRTARRHHEVSLLSPPAALFSSYGSTADQCATRKPAGSLLQSAAECGSTCADEWWVAIYHVHEF